MTVPEAGVPQPLVVPTGERRYRLVADYTYTWRTDGVYRRIIVPEGFESDGASVPRILWTLTGISPDGLIRAAAFVHDWIYRHKGRLPVGSYQEFHKGKWEARRVVIKREQGDRLFARIMRESSVAKWRRRAAYLGVRIGGWNAWR